MRAGQPRAHKAPPRRRGRPSAIDDSSPSAAAVLDAALDAFAARGFAGMSVREVARQLGVSHNLIPQRFGSKDRLWYAAVDHGFGLLLEDLMRVLEHPPPDDLSRLRAMVVRFVEANVARPALLRIINQEAGAGGPRLKYLFDRYIEPVRQFGEKILAQLHTQGQVRTKAVDLVYFLMTNGACGPITSPGLALHLGTMIDRQDPAAVRQYAEGVVDLLFEGIGPT